MTAGSLAGADLRAEQIRRLTEISRALTYTTSLEQVMRLSVSEGAQLLAASTAVLMLRDAEGQMHVREAYGVEEERLARFRAPLDDELVERLCGMMAVAEECLIAVPLVVAGEVTGLLAVATPQAGSSEDEWLLSALADQAAVAIENARLGGEVRLEMEERLRVSERATASKDRALSTLAHDIRTPLGAIEGYCAILTDEVAGPLTLKQREIIGRVQLSGRHLLSLLDTVMDMAALNAGVIRVTAGPVRLRDVATETVQMLIPAAKAKTQSLTIGSADDVVVSADHERLRQVLVNLVGNAVKFTPEGGRITVSTAARVLKGQPCGEVSVSDTGPGVSRAEQAAIFEPFYRTEGAAEVAGVGLGLAISQALVAQMGGELLLDSRPGAGSTFTVRLFPPEPQATQSPR